MSGKTFTIDFIDADRNLPLVTLRGADASWIRKHSGLIQQLENIEKSNKGYTVPVSLPTDRALILKKLLRKEPLGFMGHGTYYTRWYPLGPEEEAEIFAHLQDERKKKGLEGPPTALELNDERGHVIYQVLTYLMLDPASEQDLILINSPETVAPPNANRNERVRRSAISNRREYGNRRGRGLPYLNEDQIQNYIETHKNHLYSWYGDNPKLRGRLNTLMTRKNVAERNAKQQAFKNKQEQKRERRRTRAHKWWSNSNNNSNNYNNNNDGPFYRVNMPLELNQFGKNYSRMSSLEFERFIRSLRGKAEKDLPYQGNLSPRNLFGNANNL